MAKKLIPLVVLVAGFAIYWYVNRPPSEIVLTGIVTTHEVVVSPQIQGRLDKLLVSEGDTVPKGALLAVLAPDELREERAFYGASLEGAGAQVAQSEAALRLEAKQVTEQIAQAEATLAATTARRAASEAELQRARLEYERAQAMSTSGIGTAQALEQARSAYEVAKSGTASLAKEIDAARATVSLARASLDEIAIRRTQLTATRTQRAAAAAQRSKADVRLAYTELRAPIAGIVDTRAAREGEVVTPGGAVLTLIDPDNLWVRADVEETYIDRVKLGDRVQVRLPSGAERQGTVVFRGVDAGFATQRDVSRTKRDIKTFEIRLKIDNADRRLATGMTAYVLLPVGKAS
jgi:multidrug resistance efflux pump